MSDYMEEIVIFFCVLLVIVAIVAAVHDEHAWERYAAQHHCRAIGTKAGQVGIGPAMGRDGGVATTYTPDQTIYSCDGGEIEIR